MDNELIRPLTKNDQIAFEAYRREWKEMSPEV